MAEPKIMTRGRYYLSPFRENHIPEIRRVLSAENIKELFLLGHNSVEEALNEMLEVTESYIVREEGGDILFVGGLWFDGDLDAPQMFAMFSNKIKENFTLLARGSRMLVNFFDQTQPMMTMTILSEHEAMIQWAVWLGFEPVGVTEYKAHKYVEFVRCNPKQKNVYDKARPVKH